MFDWLKRKLASAPPVKPLTPKPFSKFPLPIGYTVAEFRANPSLQDDLNKFLLHSGTGRHFLTALHNAIPQGYPLRGQAVNDTMAAIELGRVQGHLDLMAVIYAMTQPATGETEIEQTYGEEEILKKDL